MDTKNTINRNFRHLAIFLAILIAPLWSMLSMAAEQPTADLRLLIDVSGSMKKNDPQNLRAPAVRLLVGMLPENAHSGIWTFGQWVAPVVSTGRVDKAWRRKARGAAGKIHSREMFTDIEQALRKATSDWSEPDPRFRRNVILLTDGLVDISKDQAKNQASRRSILEQLLPRIEASGARIHTIALSPNSDRSLMEQLSAATGGWYEQVDDAKTLDRLFLRLFEQSTTPDTLPLKNNRFTVDGSISDMTVLAFRYSIDDSLTLIAPNGKKYSVLNYPAKVQWLRESNYDLVTVEAPSQGEWRLDAPEDPDNRVTVVTNLRLEVDPIPAHVVSESTPALHTHLRYDSANADRPDFLDWVEFKLRDTAQDSGDTRSISLWDKGEPPDSEAGDGIYSAALKNELPPGLHELVVVADGGSFSREYRQMVRVHAQAVDIQIEPKGSSPADLTGFRLDVRIEPALLQTENLQVRAYLENEDNNGSPLSRVAQNKWRKELPATLSGHIVEVEVNGMARNGRPYTLSRRLHVGTDAPEVVTETVPIEEIVPKEEDPAPENEASEMNWGVTAVLIFFENLLLGLACWLGYTLWKRRITDKQQPDMESTVEQSNEAKDHASSEVPESRLPDEDKDSTQSQEPQQTASESSDMSAENGYEVSRSERSAQTEPAETEEDVLPADPFTINEFDNEIGAGLEAWDGEPATSEFSEEELDAGESLEEIDSLEDSTQDTNLNADTIIEDGPSETAENLEQQSTSSELNTDTSGMDDKTTSMPESQDDSLGKEAQKPSELEPETALDLDISNLDEAPFNIDLSDDPDEMGQPVDSSTSEEQNVETETAQTSAPLGDDYEQNLIDALEGSDDLPLDSDRQEDHEDMAATADNAKTGEKAQIGPNSASKNVVDDPNNKQAATPDESEKVAR